jgi:putative thioredoxin
LQAADEAGDAKALLAAGDTQAALDKLAEALHLDPANDDVRFELVRLLIECNLITEAERDAGLRRRQRFPARSASRRCSST